MSRLFMLAGAVTQSGDPAGERVSAFVVLSEGVKSRLFKVSGKTSAPTIEELGAATTLDVKMFREVAERELRGAGWSGAIRPADGTWACEAVRLHLRCDLGL
jgi:hypothetical protein